MGGRLGELEQLLLMALVRRGGEASAIDLREELEERTGRVVLPGAVYTVMERMLERDFVSAYTGEATPERGGRRRKYYSLERAGERALAHSYRQVRRMAEGIAARLERGLEGT
ncbi:MAG: PadR family transcriptional regulator [Gemmatimonadota bacterium]